MNIGTGGDVRGTLLSAVKPAFGEGAVAGAPRTCDEFGGGPIASLAATTDASSSECTCASSILGLPVDCAVGLTVGVGVDVTVGMPVAPGGIGAGV